MSTSEAAGRDDFIVVAEVVKAVGLKGEIKIYPLIDWYEPLVETGFLKWDDGSPFEVRRVRSGGGALVVLAEGCHSRQEAEAAVGRRIVFRRGDYLEPEFPRPVMGLPFRFLDREVVLGSGEVVGLVSEVRSCGGQMILVVPDGDREILIPAVEPILRPDEEISGRLVIDPPEGLLDVAGN